MNGGPSTSACAGACSARASSRARRAASTKLAKLHIAVVSRWCRPMERVHG